LKKKRKYEIIHFCNKERKRGEREIEKKMEATLTKAP
jgi:hypothetical protein